MLIFQLTKNLLDLSAWRVRLSRLLVGFRTHLLVNTLIHLAYVHSVCPPYLSVTSTPVLRSSRYQNTFHHSPIVRIRVTTLCQ